MNQIDTRPQQVASVLAYRENSLPLIATVNQEDDISGAEISVELQNSSGKMLYAVTTFTVMGQIILVNFTRQQVKEMPAIANCVIIINGVYSYGFKITPQTGFGTPANNVVELTISLKGDKGDPGDLTAEAQQLKDLMTEDREATASDREAVHSDALAVEAGRSQTVIKASEAAADRQQTGLDRVATENAKNIAVGITANPRPATNAEMLALCELGKPKRFTVVTDSDGSANVPYYWDGAVLFFYGLTPADIQPTF